MTNPVFGVVLLSISTLQLGHKQKYGLFFVIAVGSLSIVAAVARYVVVMLSLLNPNSNTASTTRAQQMWGSLEMLFAIWAICLPPLKGYFNFFKERSTVSGQSASGKLTIGRIGIERNVMVHSELNSQTELKAWAGNDWENKAVQGRNISEAAAGPASK